MIRIIRYHGCDPAMGTAPNIKIKPPVFASATDAWNHFVRHPEEFLPVDEDDSLESSVSQSYTDFDVFDSLDSFMFAERTEPIGSSEGDGVAHEDEPATTSEGNGLRTSDLRSEEQPVPSESA